MIYVNLTSETAPKQLNMEVTHARQNYFTAVGRHALPF